MIKFSLLIPDSGIKTQNCAFCEYYIWDTPCPSGITGNIYGYLIYHKYYFFSPYKY